MKKLIILLAVLSLIIISSCMQDINANVVVESKNTSEQNTDSNPSQSNVITASFVVVPPKNTTK